jgi:predicted DNA-binding protein (UPF0251 family)
LEVYFESQCAKPGFKNKSGKRRDLIFGICHKRTMSRPPIGRRIGHCAPVTYFKPQGIPLRMLEAVALAADELEAIRLADFEGLYQEQAAEQMGVSRQTFGLIIARAHKKVAEALTHGKAICIEGITPPAPVEEPEEFRGGRGCGRHGHGRGCR